MQLQPIYKKFGLDLPSTLTLNLKGKEQINLLSFITSEDKFIIYNYSFKTLKPHSTNMGEIRIFTCKCSDGSYATSIQQDNVQTDEIATIDFGAESWKDKKQGIWVYPQNNGILTVVKR